MKTKRRKVGKLKPRKSPLKLDPSRTGMDRRKISREIIRRFTKLKKELHQLIVVEDALGLKQPVSNEEGENCGTGAGGFKPGNTCAKGGGKSKDIVIQATKGVEEYLGITPEYTDLKVLSEEEFDAKFGGDTDSITGGIAAIRTPDGSIYIKEGYESDAVHELTHAAGTLDHDTSGSGVSTYLNEGITQSITVKVAQRSGIVMRETYAEEVSDVEKWVIPATGLSHQEFSKGYAKAKDKAEFITDHIWQKHQSKFSDAGEWGSDPRGAIKSQMKSFIGPTPHLEYIHENLTTNTRWAFLTYQDKLREFLSWLKTKVAIGILSTTFLQEPNHWLQEHIQRMYFKGVSRAFDEVRNPTLAKSLDWYEGTRGEFLRSAFGRAVDMARVKLLASRAFNELNGVTDQMAQTIQRELTDGMILGESPRVVGARLNKVVDGYKNRGLTIARTETLRAHNEGALDAMEKLGVEEIGVMVEWSTAEDEKVCPKCKPLQGVVMKISEAHGLLPRHPNCRCVPIPANVGESTEGQKRTKAEIEEAIGRSIEAESPNRPLDEQRRRSSWGGADLEVSKKRPKSILED